MKVEIRPATIGDAAAMADLLNRIIEIGGSTAHDAPFSPYRIVETFIAPPLALSCFVACSEARLIGFQALEWSDPDWHGEDRLAADWAIIATYVDPACHRQGVGSRLFDQSRQAAKLASAAAINATVRKENASGRKYYSGIGFVDFDQSGDSVSMRFDLG